MWQIFAGLVWASSGDDAARALVDHPESEVAIACAPAGALMAAASKIPLPPVLFQELPADRRALFDLLDPDRAAASGVDRDGVVVLRSQAEGRGLDELRLPFRGTAEQAETMLEAIFPEVVRSGEVWRVREGGNRFLARVDETSVVVEAVRAELTGSPAPAVSPSVIPLVAGFPTVPGCSAIIRRVDTENADGDAAFFIPLAGQAPMLARVRVLDMPAPPEFGRGQAPGVGARSPERPSAVVHISVPVDLLIDLLAREPKLNLAELARIHDLARLGAGASLAIFGSPQDRRFAAVVPVLAADGTPIDPRAARAFIVKASDGELRRQGRAGFRGRFDDQEFFGLVQPHRVIVATDATLLSSVMSDVGEPWVQESMRAFAEEFPITLTTLRTEDVPLEARVGMRSREGMWEVSMAITGLSPEFASMMTGVVAGIAAPLFAAEAQKSAREQLLADVDTLRTAELAWLTDNGSALALEASPRAVEGLDRAPVAWVAAGNWIQLGWSPADERVKGTYWVETTEDGKGFTVYGAVDLDGDGTPARCRATRDLPASWETEDTVR